MSSEDDSKIFFRSIQVDDLEPLRALHEECFPVRYADSFYQAAVRERMVGTNDPLFTLIAEIENQHQQKEIVAFITAQLAKTRNCGDKDMLYTPPSNFYDSETQRVMYILTLGTHPRYRRRGLARYMLKKCIRRAEQEPGLGVVYLHVITHNHQAIAFYKANHFRYLGELQDYYRINGKLYNCYVYAYYLPKAIFQQRQEKEEFSPEGTSLHPSMQTKRRQYSLSASWAAFVPSPLHSCLVSVCDSGDSASSTSSS